MNPGLRAPAMALVLLLAFALAGAAGERAHAQPAGDVAPLVFDSADEEARFHALTEELRCVMCQNQSLADSNAQIAQDMRREVLALMRQGKSDAEVKQFLVDRYGQFVLYRPEVGAQTWLLWFGPGLVLLGGAAMVGWIVRRRAASLPPPARNDEGARGDGEQEW
jgi:cytochrome c-type biogenesis protein CcmH